MSHVELKPVSDEEIKELNLALNDLWMMKTNDIVSGPFHTQLLKQYFTNHKELMSSTEVRCLEGDSWVGAIEQPEFKIKTPVLPSLGNMINHQRYFLLIDSQIKGPFTFDNIKEKLEHQELNIFDIISADEGTSWKKIFQFEALRNVLDRPELPSQHEIEFENDINTHHSPLASTAVQGLVAVVHLSHQTDQKLKIDEVQLPMIASQNSRQRLQLMTFASFVLVLGLGFAIFSNNKTDDTPLADADTAESFNEETLKPKRPRSHRSPASLAPRQVIQRSNNNDSSNSRRFLQREPAYNPPIDEIRETHAEIAHQDMEEPREEPAPEGSEPNISRGAASEAPPEDAIPVEEVGDF